MRIAPKQTLTRIIPIFLFRIDPKRTRPNVIRLKLFLDIVTSSAEDITRAMRGQPKRLSRTT